MAVESSLRVRGSQCRRSPSVPTGSDPPTGSRARRALTVVMVLCVLATLLAACASETSTATPDDRTESPSPREPEPILASPSIEGETPDQRFETWLETGGVELELYEPWVSGELPGEGPPSNASNEELRALFEEWVDAHMTLIRGAWNRAEDRGAQSDLRNGLAVALVFFVDAQSFAGLTPREGHSIDPSLTFNVGKTLFGEISIRQTSATAVLLTTESAAGTVFCAAYVSDNGEPTSLGMVDAKTASDCAGGWPE